MTTEKATFGAGCFWGAEAAFAAIPGIISTAVGYEGGQLERPSYKDVCTDSTGHAEVVELDFDPAQVSRRERPAPHFLRFTTPRPSTAKVLTGEHSTAPQFCPANHPLDSRYLTFAGGKQLDCHN